MESTASASDAQDTDADSRTMDIVAKRASDDVTRGATKSHHCNHCFERRRCQHGPEDATAPISADTVTSCLVAHNNVQHDDDESPATTESQEGWHTIYYGRRRKPGHESVRDADGVHGANNKVEPGFGNTQAKTQERRMSRIVKVCRMPKLPAGDYKIVIRLRGGLRVAVLGPTDITRGIHEAVATSPEVRHFDVICPNKTQNIMIVSTLDPNRADQYRKIKKILLRGKEYD
ncbi:hypothetical protein HPB51_001050 [Rhipicephalus microplus]|uniref:Uncharacterized protein n=1 Tax=Rhipicephalus microplus TaxID=6941 RepID=A0A9J6DKS6_RHIMP|nr:hypothetical protein HPB51_001050 [Rhipicephalus microplus]